MGINGLPKYLTTNTETAVRSFKLSACRGWKVAVDSSLLVYQIVTAMRSGGNETVNANGEITSHLTGICNKVLGFLQNGIIPVFVFDGASPEIKRITSELRANNCRKAEEKLANLDPQSDEYLRNHARAFHATKEHFDEAKILLSLMGIPYVNAPGEADVVCSWLASRRGSNKERYVVGVATEDSDMLPLGTPYLLKNMISSVTCNHEFVLISLRRVLKQLNITMEQFVDTCVLLGTDYSKNIKGLGPVGIKTAMAKYKNLDTIIDVYRKKQSDDTIEEFETNVKCMHLAKEYFMNALTELDESDFTVSEDQLQMKMCQKDNLIDFLVNKHNFDPANVIYKINKLVDYQKELGALESNDYEYESTNVKNKSLEYMTCEYVFE